MIDIDSLLASVNLVDLIGRDTTLRKSGAWHSGPCPICRKGQHDCLVIRPGGRRWLCRKCTDGKYLDALDYVARRENLDLHRGQDFRRACELLGTGDLTPLPVRPKPQPAVYSTPNRPPSAEWQDRARHLITECEATLWADAGSRARVWLNERGLNDDTLRRWHIGYNPAERFESLSAWGLPEELNDNERPKKIWLPQGIVVPCIIGGVVWFIKIRRLLTQAEIEAGEKRYPQVKGSRPALFGAEGLRGHDVAMLVEGEFDAMLLEQETRGLVGVATLGSASTRNINLITWGVYLLPLTRLLVAYDLDEGGNRGAAAIANLTARARRVRLPPMKGIKDITDFHNAGGNLRDWLTFELARQGFPPPLAEAHKDKAISPAATPHVLPNDSPITKIAEINLPSLQVDTGTTLAHNAELERVWLAWHNDPDPAHEAAHMRAYALAAIDAGLPCYADEFTDIGAAGWREWAGLPAVSRNDGEGSTSGSDLWQFILDSEAEAVAFGA